MWPEVRSSHIPARVKTRTSSDHRGGYRARSPASEGEGGDGVNAGRNCALRSHSHTRRWLGGAYASTDMDMVLLLRDGQRMCLEGKRENREFLPRDLRRFADQPS